MAMLLAACATPQKDMPRLQKLASEDCQLPHTPASSIQGSQLASSLTGSQHAVIAIVNHLSPGRGFFIEQPLADGDQTTSDALWIEDSRLSDTLKIGDQVRLEGTVAELGNPPHSLTALTAITGYVVCAESQPLPLHETGLPLSVNQREALEGMRVQMQQNLVVTNVRDALTRQQISVSLGSRLYSPTQRDLPGEAAAGVGVRNQDNVIALQWPDHSGTSLFDANPDEILVNDGVFQFSGVLNDTRYQYAVLMESFGWLPTTRKIPAPLPHKGNLRISSLNLLNYFNGDGAGGGFQTERGAKSPEEFEQQRRRLLSTITAMDPDVLGVMEVENDGFGPASAIQDLVGTLNQQNPDAEWRMAIPQTDRLGNGMISVGIIFKKSSVQPLGPANTLDTGTFIRRSRRPLAQRFMHNASGQSFMVVVNHFKSKSSCPEDGPDSAQGDGQGCWNPTRVASADELDQWLNSLRNILDEKRFVILGDFNAMPMEDPIRLLSESGWINQAGRFNHPPLHTYNFRGAASTLDYIFTSETMSEEAADARVWPINADYPIGGIENGPEYIRSSDHDPVVADFNLTQN